MGGKNVRNNFSRNTRIVRAKKLGKNRPKKVRKMFFLNSHEYRDQKIGVTKCARQFFQKHTNSARKNVWKKMFGK